MSFISISIIVSLAGGCHCQKHGTDSRIDGQVIKTNTETPESVNVVLDSNALNKKVNPEVIEIKHSGPEQSKVDSVKMKKNKLKTK